MRPLVRAIVLVTAATAVTSTAWTAEITVHGDAPAGQAASHVSKRDLDERLPRSAPDALRWEPGVFVQQTAHGQASPIVRGRTGQQTLLLFDGIRLNNSTYRQGPNQYFFTVDARSVQSIDVVRGGASTRFGSDALGGVIHAHPTEPELDPDRAFYLRPRAMLRFGSADGEFGERFQVDAQLSRDTQILTGVGFRRVGRLRSGGAITSPLELGGTGEVPQVPAFEADGKTMLGTGYRELTGDLRVVHRLSGELRLVGAAYLYRQFDAPRTDLCPAPFAPRNECLTITEQFRTLAYVALESTRARIVASYQRQHERRRLDRPVGRVQNGGRDDVDTFGLAAYAETRPEPIAAWWSLVASAGLDVYADRVGSSAYTRFTDLDLVLPATRGQYVDGARYVTSGVFAQAASTLFDALVVRMGGRLGLARADSPEDVPSATAAVARSWLTNAAFLGLEWRARPFLSFLASADRSFRAPNLDDLTSRQQTGPGFQLENPNLRAEVGHTFELGARFKAKVLTAEAWIFRAIVDDAITRTLVAGGTCPAETPQCGASATRLQLVNVDRASTIDGVELALRARLGDDVVARATFAWAIGRGPDPSGASSSGNRDVPLSRIAPMNGTAELRWSPVSRAWLGAGVRWAGAQTRLAPTDRSDARIPIGGTPGFALLDLRAGYRIDRRMVVSAVLENLFDAAYRHHGSSINGPGRSILFAFETGL